MNEAIETATQDIGRVVEETGEKQIAAAFLRPDGLDKTMNRIEELARSLVPNTDSAAGRQASQMPCVIFNPAAVANFLHHFKVKIGALFDALGFN